MSASRFHNAIAIGLAALYSVVGLTGEALYYFSADSPAGGARARPALVEGYYHVHGPDLHLHFHAYRHHTARTGRSAVATLRQASRYPKGKAFSHGEDLHRPHGSPLLGLIAKLKLSRPSGSTFALVANLLTALAYEPASTSVRGISAHTAPRGPPRKYSVA